MTTGTLMRDMAPSAKPREKLAAHGADALDTSELIAILLRTGTKGKSAIDLGNELLGRFRNSLTELARAPIEELRIKGIGRDKAATLKAAFTLARKMADELRRESPVLDTPERIAELLRTEVVMENVECFYVLLVNTRRRLIRVERLSRGTLDTLLIHPREVFRPAIAANASAIILAHNHPSADPSPSEADIKVTRDLIRAGQLLKIEVLDHLIMGQRSADRPRDFVSLKELGYFYS